MSLFWTCASVTADTDAAGTPLYSTDHIRAYWPARCANMYQSVKERTQVYLQGGTHTCTVADLAWGGYDVMEYSQQYSTDYNSIGITLRNREDKAVCAVAPPGVLYNSGPHYYVERSPEGTSKTRAYIPFSVSQQCSDIVGCTRNGIVTLEATVGGNRKRAATPFFEGGTGSLRITLRQRRAATLQRAAWVQLQTTGVLVQPLCSASGILRGGDAAVWYLEQQITLDW